MKISLTIDTWWRESTNEWVGEINYKAENICATARFTGSTKEAARNAAYASVGYVLLSTTFKDGINVEGE